MKISPPQVTFACGGLYFNTMILLPPQVLRNETVLRGRVLVNDAKR